MMGTKLTILEDLINMSKITISVNSLCYITYASNLKGNTSNLKKQIVIRNELRWYTAVLIRVPTNEWRPAWCLILSFVDPLFILLPTCKDLVINLVMNNTFTEHELYWIKHHSVTNKPEPSINKLENVFWRCKHNIYDFVKKPLKYFPQAWYSVI